MEFLYTLFGILLLLCRIIAQLNVNTVELAAVFGLMVGKSCSVILAFSLIAGQIGQGGSTGITAHVVVLLEVCCLRDNDCGVACPTDDKLGNIGCWTGCSLSVDIRLAVGDGSVAINNPYICAEIELVVDTLVL